MNDVRKPELTRQEADAVVDAFLHHVLSDADSRRHLRSELITRLEGLSEPAKRRVMNAWQKRREHFQRTASKISL